MGTISEKLQYTKDAVDDIQAALIEKGVEVAETDELSTYGEKIRSLNKIKVIRNYCDITAGEWTGAALSDSSWVNICSSSIQSQWVHNLPEELDVKKVKFICASIIETNYGLRMTRASSAYHFFQTLTAFGDVNVSSLADNGGINITDIYARCAWYVNNVNYNDLSNAAEANMLVNVEKDKIRFVFNYIDRGLFAIRSSKPKFAYVIGYEK